ncbi:MAG: pantothenate kinase [Clostridiales bacterium]|nr:MAG: pantothenate kinase [Clostridiales bacterium]
MILAINIGNTNFMIACDDEKTVYRYPVADLRVSDNFKDVVNDFLRCKIPGGVIISSVVPALTGTITSAIYEMFNIKPIVVNSDMHMSIDLSLYDKKFLGSDRIAVSEAVFDKTGKAGIVYDFGTATTINVVNSRGFFLGGAILPGVKMGLISLSQNTAQLPEYKDPLALPPLLGQNTADCLLSGAVYGNATMVDSMSARIKEFLQEDADVYMTGGNASFIAQACNTNIILEPNLLIQGLYSLYNKNKKEEK